MQAWDEFLKTLEAPLGKNTIDQWLRPLKIQKFDARNLYLEAPDSLQIHWFEEHIRPRLKNKFCNNNNQPIQVHFSKNQEAPTKAPLPTYSVREDLLDKELTFDNFIVCEENKMAFEIIQKPSFNPIYLFGPKHSGKTHLLTATALALQAQGKKVFYVRAETFTSHVVQAIRLGGMRQFREVYREIDVLLIDDVDFLANKQATQEEFFHTFNVLHTRGDQVILSASSPPSQLTGIEPRLMSRFEWGISLTLRAPPSFQILQNKARLWKLSYSEELLQFLAETFSNKPLLALQALMLRAKGPITPKIALSLLQDLLVEETKEILTPEKITAQIAQYFGIRPEDILGKSQAKEHANPRQLAMFLCREKLKLPFQKIGEIFHRDHSTVMSSVKQIQKASEEKTGAIYDALQKIAIKS